MRLVTIRIPKLVLGSVIAVALSSTGIAQKRDLVRTGSFEIGGFGGASYGIDEFRVMGGGNATFAVTKRILPYVEYSYFPEIGRRLSGVFPGTGRPYVVTYTVP